MTVELTLFKKRKTVSRSFSVNSGERSTWGRFPGALGSRENANGSYSWSNDESDSLYRAIVLLLASASASVNFSRRTTREGREAQEEEKCDCV